MAEPLTLERLAWIRDHAQRQYTIESDEADDLLAEVERLRAERDGAVQAAAQREKAVRALVAERDRLRAQVAAVEAVCRRVTLDGFETAYVSSIRAAQASDG